MIRVTQFDIAYTDFKHEDTTNDITITLYTDDKRPITPNISHTWKAKVAKDDKYVGEYPVAILGNQIKLSSSNLTRLPDGNYALELWETYDGSTAIYPSVGVMGFRVHKNVDDTLGTIDPTTDINGIIDDLHKAGQNIKVVATNTLPAGSKASVTQSITNGENQLTFYIPQGDKGDKGDVGPAPTLEIGTVTKLNPDQAPTANLSGGNGSYTLNLGIPQGVQGETNATATQALDIAKSVDSRLDGITSNGGGVNLLTGSKTMYGVWATDGTSISSEGDYLAVRATGTNMRIYQNPSEDTTGKLMSVSFDAEVPADSKNQSVQIKVGPFQAGVDVTISGNAFKRYKVENWKWNSASKAFSIHFKNANDKINIRKIKLEFGAVATPWSPAPEEILTQSDYAKIKAAIVALGGSLS